ncbi:MAG: cadherin [Saprospiraceae bacterium]|nr:cadherin [Saprospiraceae bacterium]
MKKLVNCFIGLTIGLFSWTGALSQISIEEFAINFSQPVDIANAGDGSNRLFIVEKVGRIQVLDEDGQKGEQPFLDISSKVDSDASEEGLLGLVFHPEYQQNGYFFVYYTATVNSIRDAVIERYSVSADSSLAEHSSGVEVMRINQPQSNHNGGDMAFGPEGNLYIGVGDGGSGNDPGERSQNLTLPLGKMLRINVDNLPYSIPANNPYAQMGGDTVREIWAVGLRNPWRFSFDDNYDLWIGDVGQSAREEINFISASENVGGLNYGWDCREGDIACPGCGNNQCDEQTFTDPVHWYGPGPGLSVTGGYVMRGEFYNVFEGHYIFAEFARDQIRTLQLSPGRSVAITATIPANNISSFGEDEKGRVYAANLSGIIYRVVEAGILPVELIAVHIKKENKKVFLDWETGFEFNASHFEVERSLGQESFKQVGIVPSKGDAGEITNYQFIDQVYRPGDYSYRLKSMDLDGSYTYSMNLTIKIENNEDMLVLPNPALDKIRVGLPVMQEAGHLQIVGLDGAILHRIAVSPGDEDAIEIDVKEFRRGLVLVQFIGEGNISFTKKLMLY